MESIWAGGVARGYHTPSVTKEPVTRRARPSAIADGHFRAIVEMVDDAVYVVSNERRIVYWNAAAELVTGYSAREVVGWNCDANLLQHVDETGTPLCLTHCSLHQTLTDGVRRTVTLFLRHKEGHRVPVVARIVPLRDEEGAVVGAAEIFSSAAPDKQAAQHVREAQRFAFEDALTGLPNRRYVEKELGVLLRRARQEARPLGVLLIDLDHFKSVNDQHGHSAGDEALRVVANTLAANVRPLDVVGRWGGEEFLVLLPDVSPASLALVADRLRVLVKRSRVRGSGAQGLCVSISGGASLVCPTDTPQEVIERVDALLYESKRGGRDRITHDLCDGSAAHRRTALRSPGRRRLELASPPLDSPSLEPDDEPPSTP